MKKISKKELLSIPDLMGYFRIILIPVFCVIYLKADSVRDYYIAAAIILVSTITDLLDGQVARRFHMITEFVMAVTLILYIPEFYRMMKRK